MPSASTNTQINKQLFLYEGEGEATLDAKFKFELLDTLLGLGYRIQTSTSSEALKEAHDKGFLVLSQSLSEKGVNLNGATIESIVQDIKNKLQGEDKNWKPWFPVIDFDRCTNCMQCLTFCLFDVYGVSDDQKIQVANAQNCKTDCPACSRVCPEVAILFPKYRHGPINGDTVKEDDIRREKMKVDISSLLGGDIYQTLRDRSMKAKSRFSKERDEDKALKERKKCLTKLKEQFDIPDEVLASLPDDEQIQQKFSNHLQRLQS